jgi:hypothetical protein
MNENTASQTSSIYLFIVFTEIKCLIDDFSCQYSANVDQILGARGYVDPQQSPASRHHPQDRVLAPQPAETSKVQWRHIHCLLD